MQEIRELWSEMDWDGRNGEDFDSGVGRFEF
jgi:hypothetical protein